jgi:hypothetical protein
MPTPHAGMSQTLSDLWDAYDTATANLSAADKQDKDNFKYDRTYTGQTHRATTRPALVTARTNAANAYMAQRAIEAPAAPIANWLPMATTL